MQRQIAATLIAEALALVDESVADSHITNVEHDPSDDTLLVEGVDEVEGPYRVRLDIMSGQWGRP